MTGSNAQKVVIAAMFAMLAGVLYQQYKAGGTLAGATYKRLWAVGVVTLVLGALADFIPQVVVPFAVAVVIGFYLYGIKIVPSGKTPRAGGGASGEGGASAGSRSLASASPSAPTPAQSPFQQAIQGFPTFINPNTGTPSHGPVPEGI